MRSGVLRLALLLTANAPTPSPPIDIPLYVPGNEHLSAVQSNGEMPIPLQSTHQNKYFLSPTASYKEVDGVPMTGLLYMEKTSKAGSNLVIDTETGYLELKDGKLSAEPIDFAAELANRTCLDESPIGTKESPEDAILSSIEEAVIQYYPDCYTGDEGGRYMDIAFVTDIALYQKLGSDLEKVKEFVEDTVVKARLVYYKQFNIILRIHSLRIYTESYEKTENGFPLSMSLSSCVSDYSYVIQSLYAWNARFPPSPKTAAITHLFTGCWGPYGVVGIAYLNTLCLYSSVGTTTLLSSSITWLIFAHEVAHNLGATHTFQNGMGKTGGLMDYGNPYYQEEIQFRPESASEMCTGLQAAMSRSTCAPAFPTLKTKCGDLLLEQFQGEECECLDSTASCPGCKNCKLADTDRECSSKDFVVLSPGNNASIVSVLPTLLHHSECCSESGRIRSSLSNCGANGADACSNGFCARRCSGYGYASCPMEEDGCVQPCKISADVKECYSDWRTISTKTYISRMPEGTKCGMGAKGKCAAGKCVQASTDEPTAVPTTATNPDPTQQPSPAPTSSPVPRPTRRPSTHRPTRGPTSQAPTDAPDPSGTPTAKPTPKPFRPTITKFPTRRPTRKTTRRPTAGGTRYPSRARRTHAPSRRVADNGSEVGENPPYRICHGKYLNRICGKHTRKRTCNADTRCRFMKYDMKCRASCRNKNKHMNEYDS